MAYRLPSERITLEIEDGPTVEVEKVTADLIYLRAVGLVEAVYATKTPAKQSEAAQELFAFFVIEGQPTWEIVDHRGTVLPTVSGMARLPLKIALDICLEWANTFIEKETAVDKIIPPGEMRDELNKRLRASRKAA